MQKKVLLTTAIALTGGLPAIAMADLSANVGWVSEYIYRGVYQEDSSAYGGFDFEDDSGFYAGVWGADVGVGLETDLYFGYSGSAGDDFGYSIGWTGYFYTENDPPGSPEPGFYDTITEINLGISYGIFSLDHAIGEEDGWGSPTDYTFTTLTIAPEVGPYYSFNAFGDMYSGEYFEIGYGWELADVDLSISFMYALDVPSPGSPDPEYVLLLSEDVPYADTALVLGISKSFPIGD
jgi:uncharacterized protein (TIGR02001 family)